MLLVFRSLDDGDGEGSECEQEGIPPETLLFGKHAEILVNLVERKDRGADLNIGMLKHKPSRWQAKRVASASGCVSR
jgi:hypothetical protein